MKHKANKLKKARVIQSTPEEPQHTTVFSRVGCFFIIASLAIIYSLIIILW